MPHSQDRIEIHSDGSCLGNPGPGGYGVVLATRSGRKEVSAGYRLTTNNRMELLGAITGLEALKRPSRVTLTTDSRYVVDGITKGWAKTWKANGWRRGRNKKEQVLNPDLWDRLLTAAGRHEVTFRWIKGHAGNPENERCDQLAKQAAEMPGLRVDEVYEGVTAQPNDAAPAEEPQPPDAPAPRLSHLDEGGEARMVDVGEKAPTDRFAEARAQVRMAPPTLRLIREGGFDKGDVLGTARLAGVMAAKQTSNLIPLCHPVPLSQVTVDFAPAQDDGGIEIIATARAHWKTGVEMEALTAALVAALTIYDMCKSAERGIVIDHARLTRKSGGRSGDYSAH